MKYAHFIYTSIILSISVLYSCSNDQKTSSPAPARKMTSELIKDHFQNKKQFDKTPESSKVVLEFIDYNDDGDYFLLNAKKGRILYSFINDKNEDRSLLRGDLVEITWKWDTIYIAGDGETPELAEWIVSIKKMKDGKISVFRKQYPEKMPYSVIGDDNLTSEFKDKLYSLVEYYLANSKKESVKQCIRNKQELSFTIEDRDEKEPSYIALGIYGQSDGQSKIIQWLWYSPNTDMLFEYDQNHDKLTPFR
ncbi:hypothetical protein [uncultured Fluviicola sp.]|uniref:hypothetical protein n=1 Tax=uncultured Fluviicola sp. TaxID=463303 RepID=UPI0025FB7201|nr:hypothetical protein [uncultured Fluviicola sp.]